MAIFLVQTFIIPEVSLCSFHGFPLTQLRHLNLNEWQTKARDIVQNNMASSRTYLNFELKHRFNFSRKFWHQYISLTLLGNAKELAYVILVSLAACNSLCSVSPSYKGVPSHKTSRSIK